MPTSRGKSARRRDETAPPLSGTAENRSCRVHRAVLGSPRAVSPPVSVAQGVPSPARPLEAGSGGPAGLAPRSLGRVDAHGQPAAVDPSRPRGGCSSALGTPGEILRRCRRSRCAGAGPDRECCRRRSAVLGPAPAVRSGVSARRTGGRACPPVHQGPARREPTPRRGGRRRLLSGPVTGLVVSPQTSSYRHSASSPRAGSARGTRQSHTRRTSESLIPTRPARRRHVGRSSPNRPSCRARGRGGGCRFRWAVSGGPAGVR